jgi:drug/metabolite transporter (DMT)-like permease
MIFLFPFLAAILQAGSFTLDKVVLSVRQVDFKVYTGISFPLIFFITLVIFLIFQPPLSFELFRGNLWWLLSISIAITIITNLLFYRALDFDKLGEIQTLELLRFLPIIIFSSIIFADERQFFIIVPVLIASLGIIWSHWEQSKVKIAQYTLPFLIWMLFASPIREAASKILLEDWNPISLELVRSGAVALMLGMFFAKHIIASKISVKAFYLLLATNILTSIAWILFYFGYQYLGIIHTTLIFLLQPLLVYLASVFLLKEALSWKKNIAFVIVVLSIAAAQTFNNFMG